MSDAAASRTGFPWRAFGRRSLSVAAIAAVVFFLTLIPKTVEVFIVAMLIAYGVNPIVRRLTRRMPRAAAIALVYAALVAGIVIASVIIIPDTASQLQAFFGNGPAYVAGGQQIAQSVQDAITTRFGSKVLPPQLQDIEGRVASQVASWLNAALAGAGNLVLSIANVFIIGITAVILSYYLLKHTDEILASFYSLFPERSQEKAHAFAREVARVVGGFIFGQIVLSAFCAVATFVVLLLLRSQYALLIGVLTGLLYAVPYLGVFVALLLAAILGALQSWKMAIYTVLVIIAVTRISDLILVPKVMAESVGISPMAIIFAVFAGGELLGVWGLVLAIPAAAVFKVLWRVWIHYWLTGREAA
jgi:predicted PurR-regulated permease PerM